MENLQIEKIVLDMDSDECDEKRIEEPSRPKDIAPEQTASAETAVEKDPIVDVKEDRVEEIKTEEPDPGINGNLTDAEEDEALAVGLT